MQFAFKISVNLYGCRFPLQIEASIFKTSYPNCWKKISPSLISCSGLPSPFPSILEWASNHLLSIAYPVKYRIMLKPDPIISLKVLLKAA
ncbi:MAG: hypothetical protein NDF53_03840 [archaeon GB-1867-097]|nr:hypothetical protein [Candidatus Culexmicrobium thermophilum]